MINSPFMKFWKELNALLVKHRLPEMGYGSARDLFAQRYSTPISLWLNA